MEFGKEAAKREELLLKHLTENPDNNTLSQITHAFCHWVKAAIVVGLEDLKRAGLIDSYNFNGESTYYALSSAEVSITTTEVKTDEAQTPMQ